MLHWTEALSYRLAAARHPTARAEFAANASSTEHEAAAPLRHEGYAVAFTVLELALDAAIPVPVTPLPTGIEVRPVEVAHLPRLAASVEEAYRGEYEGGRYNESQDRAAYVAELSGERHDRTLWQAAWDGGELVGQVMSVIENGKGEVFEVSVRPAWRRRGIGRALLTRSLVALRSRNIEIIRLSTVTEFRTRARDPYESVGFRVLKEFRRYRKPFASSATV